MKYEKYVLSKCSPMGNKFRSGQLERIHSMYVIQGIFSHKKRVSDSFP